MTNVKTEKLVNAYKRSQKRLLLLDYDGTLVPYAALPELAKPGPELIELLRKLASDPLNTLAIVSGRPQPPLEEWFGSEQFTLFAEHGALLKNPGKEWSAVLEFDPKWKKDVSRLMQEAIDQVPGSFIEHKTIALVWHYRPSADQAQATRTARQLETKLQALTDKFGLRMISSNMMVEARIASVHKGTTVSQWLEEPYDFILAAGDDVTDEDLFKALPDSAYTIKIGEGPTTAKYHVPTHAALLDVLRSLAD